MRVFVASWFFPPSTSSEGIVAFKLLSHSQHQYDVCSAISDQWGFDAVLPLSSPNIAPITIKTDSLDEWIEFAIAQFKENHEKNPYDAIMTRSMPPESIEVGRRLKETYPEIPWIASLGDPISRVPHMMKNLLDQSRALTKAEKRSFREELSTLSTCDQWVGRGDAGTDVLCEYKRLEVTAIKQADMLVIPNGPQANYMLCGSRRGNVAVVSHSYDKDLYPEHIDNDSDRIEIVFMGSSYRGRALDNFIRALHHLEMNNPDALKKLHVRLIGKIEDNSRSLVYNFDLLDTVSIESSIGYLESLKVASESDWLLHVDGYYSVFNKTGGSIYLAGKLADYVGAGKPILALTGKGSPADRLVMQYGGASFTQRDVAGIADCLERIALGCQDASINEKVQEQYLSSYQAKKLDDAIDDMMKGRQYDSLPNDIVQDKVFGEGKLLSICVPSYNVGNCLPRCLDSLVASGCCNALDVIIVNDGSIDDTRDVALAYQRKYPDTFVLVDKENGGHGSTINTAIPLARGKYFRTLDGDDWLDPVELATFLKTLSEVKCQVDLVSTDYCQINIEDGAISHLRKKSPKIEYNKVYEIDKINVDREYFSLGSISYSTKLLRESNLRLSEHCFYVDVQYQMKALPWVKTVMFTDGNLYHYAVGSNEQSVSKTSFVKRYENHERVMKDVLTFRMDHDGDLCASLKSYFDYLIINHFIKTQLIITLLYDPDKKRGFSRAKQFDDFLKQVNIDWYNEAASKYPVLVDLRNNSFDPGKVKGIKSVTAKRPKVGMAKTMMRKAARKIMAGGVGDVVAMEVAKREKKS